MERAALKQGDEQHVKATGCSPTKHSHVLGEFIRFLDLPPEIRLMIWRFSFPDPRVFEVGYNLELYRLDFPMFSPPAILHVCHESREVARKMYKLYHPNNEESHLRSHRGSEAMVFFAPTRDTLCLAFTPYDGLLSYYEVTHSLEELNDELASDIELLAIPYQTARYCLSTGAFFDPDQWCTKVQLLWQLRRVCNVKVLTFVLGEVIAIRLPHGNIPSLIDSPFVSSECRAQKQIQAENLYKGAMLVKDYDNVGILPNPSIEVKHIWIPKRRPFPRW